MSTAVRPSCSPATSSGRLRFGLSGNDEVGRVGAVGRKARREKVFSERSERLEKVFRPAGPGLRGADRRPHSGSQKAVGNNGSRRFTLGSGGAKLVRATPSGVFDHKLGDRSRGFLHHFGQPSGMRDPGCSAWQVRSRTTAHVRARAFLQTVFTLTAVAPWLLIGNHAGVAMPTAQMVCDGLTADERPKPTCVHGGGRGKSQRVTGQGATTAEPCRKLAGALIQVAGTSPASLSRPDR